MKMMNIQGQLKPGVGGVCPQESMHHEETGHQVMMGKHTEKEQLQRGCSPRNQKRVP